MIIIIYLKDTKYEILKKKKFTKEKKKTNENNKCDTSEEHITNKFLSICNKSLNIKKKRIVRTS